MRSFFKVLLFLGITLFAIALVKSFTKGSIRDRSAEDSTQNQQPAFFVTSGDKTYYGAISSEVGVAILRISSSPYFVGFGVPERADGKFIYVTVAIENKQNTAITMNANLFEILDTSNNVYSASEKSMEVPPNRDLFLAGINPGVVKVGLIVFDVPANLGMDNLWLRFRGGMTGESATLALNVNALTQPAPSSLETTPQPVESGSPDIHDGVISGRVARNVSADSPQLGVPLFPETTKEQSESNNDNVGASNNAQSLPLSSSQTERNGKKISVGETTDEVVSILGYPSSVTTGAKVIYVYPHLQLIFTNGKVSDIRPF